MAAIFRDNDNRGSGDANLTCTLIEKTGCASGSLAPEQGERLISIARWLACDVRAQRGLVRASNTIPIAIPCFQTGDVNLLAEIQALFRRALVALNLSPPF